MTEINISEITVPRTYTITLQEEQRLEVMSKVTGKNKSELVRLAINDLFEKIDQVVEDKLVELGTKNSPSS